jgi:YesN/AraC family two-component response regulator
MKPRLLFVDDDFRLLRGLQRALTVKCEEWEMHFAHGGFEAVSLMEQMTFDVIVSDLRMPEMNGVELLNHVRIHHPQIARFVLSGEPDKTPDALEVAQHYFSKPCDPGVLISKLEAVLHKRLLAAGVFEVCPH